MYLCIYCGCYKEEEFLFSKSLAEKKLVCAFEKEKYPPLPKGWVFYAIGDVHGRYDLLLDAHSKIDKDKEKRLVEWNSKNNNCNSASNNKVITADLKGESLAKKINENFRHLEQLEFLEIYIGDLIDRGNDSANVIEELLLRRKNTPIMSMRGNHEIIFMKFLEGEFPFEKWKLLGGAETLLSYGVSAHAIRYGGLPLYNSTKNAIPERHIDFLKNSLNYFSVGEYCFAHAGVRPQISIHSQTLDDLAWIRQDFLEWEGDFGCIVIHGHTPVSQPDFHKNRINIDTGAYISNNLTVIAIDETGPSII